MNELQFDVELNAGVITMDTVEIEEQLKVKMQEYELKEFTEDSKKEAKDDVAYLRKLKKSVSDRDREVKKIFMKPYDNFHERVTRLISIIDAPINLIDGQVKKFEEDRVFERRMDIEKLYFEIVPDEIEDYIPLECIYGQKWTNATTKLKSIEEEISNIAEKTKNDIAVISNMNSDAVKKALHLYMSNRDLASAVNYINNYESQKREILKANEENKRQLEEKERQEERDRIRQEERERIRQEDEIRKLAKREVVEEIKGVDEKAAAPLSTDASKRVIYTVVATPDEICEIEMAMTSLGVYFERKDV